MSYASRVFLKHYLIDAVFVLFGAAFLFALSITTCTFFDLWDTITTKVWFYLYSSLYILIMSGYTLLLLWNFFGSIGYHQNVSQSKIGSAHERFSKKPKQSQAMDLLKDILLGLDHMSIRKMNEYLKKISDDSISVKLEDHTWELRDRVFRPTPRLLLVKNGEILAKLYIR